MHLSVFRRVPIAAIVVFGFGGLVALAVAISLYLGLWSATQNTRLLLQEQTEALMDTVKRRIDSRLQPVAEQAQWITSYLIKEGFSLDGDQTLDAFMLGSLAASPQIRGIALVTPEGQSRRWDRHNNEVIAEDWSGRPDIQQWLSAGKSMRTMQWQAPIWTHTTGGTVVLHDAPIWREGKFLGMLGQIVPIKNLSAELFDLTRGTEFRPFVLYDHVQVLAHPDLVAWAPENQSEDRPLMSLEELGDAVLERIWDPDEPQLFLMSGLRRSSASASKIGGNWYVFLHRDIASYGPKPWTIGVYFATDEREAAVVRRLVLALASGLGVLCLSVMAAVFVGRRLSRPVQAIATAAELVQAGQLDEVPRLPSSRVSELDDATRAINQMVDGLRESALIRQTLGRYIPAEVAKTLLREGGQLDVDATEATVLFADIEAFTRLTEALGPERIVEVLNTYFSSMVEILERHQGVVTQFQGDAILATFNVPMRDDQHASHALQAAAEMLLETHTQEFAGHRIAQRIGISTGNVLAGAVGAEGRLSYTVHGDAVNLAARLESLNKQFGTRILASASTISQTEGFALSCVGHTQVRGQSKDTALYTFADTDYRITA